MSDFLARLATRVVAPREGLRPRRPSRFEPDAGPALLTEAAGEAAGRDAGAFEVFGDREPRPERPRPGGFEPRSGPVPPAAAWVGRASRPEGLPAEAGLRATPGREAPADGGPTRTWAPSDAATAAAGGEERPRAAASPAPWAGAATARPPSQRPPAEGGTAGGEDRRPDRPSGVEPATGRGRHGREDRPPAEERPREPAAPSERPTVAPPRRHPPDPTVVVVRDVRPVPAAPPWTPSRDAPPSRAAAREPAQAAVEAPTVHVTIGRIEVRALPEDRARDERAGPTRRSPVMTLEDYLRRRSGGGSA